MYKRQVFVIIQSTRTVYQNAAGLHALRRTFQNAPLQRRQGTKIAQLLAPAKVDLVAQDSETGTRRIDQDAVCPTAVLLTDGAGILQEGADVFKA